MDKPATRVRRLGGSGDAPEAGVAYHMRTLTGRRLLSVSAVVTALLLAGAPSALAETTSSSLPDRDDIWIPAREAMRQALRKLENFSCIQNITRTEIPPARARRSGTTRDRVRLQVTHIGDKEFYGFPGEMRAVTDPRLLVKSGLIGTGSFLGYARSIFVRQPFSRLQLVGKETLGGEPVYRFAFVFDLREKLTVARAGGQGSVGARGEFVVGEKDSLVKTMRIESTDPIPELGIESVEYEIDWAKFQGTSGFLLIPQQASISMKLFTGETQRNTVELSQCREFQTESTIRFDSEEDASGAVAALPAPLAAETTLLAPHLTLAMRLREGST